MQIHYHSFQRTKIYFSLFIIVTFLTSCGISKDATQEPTRQAAPRPTSQASPAPEQVPATAVVESGSSNKSQNNTVACVVTSPELNVRSGPGIDYSPKARLKKDDIVIVGSRNPENDWLLMQKGDLAGWISAKYVNCETPIESLPVSLEPTSAANASPVQVKPSLLKRRDAPPTGFKEQLELFAGGAGPQCALYMNETAPIYIESSIQGNQEVGTGFLICMKDFVPNETVNVEYIFPNGTVKQEQLTTYEQGVAISLWRAMPGDPLGEYTITATQGKKQTSGSFIIDKASVPKIIIPTYLQPPGKAISIYLMGYQPNEIVQLQIYYRPTVDEPYRYTTALPPIQVDGEGETKIPFLIETETDDLPGDYGLVDKPVTSGGISSSFGLFR